MPGTFGFSHSSRLDFHAKAGRHFQCRFFVLFALLSATVRVAANPLHGTQAQTQRLSVIDYFNLLTRFESVGGDSAAYRDDRLLLQARCHPTIDLRHDYLLVHPDALPTEQIAVFRQHGKADLLAVSSPDSESDYNSFALYRLQNGRLRDVTEEVLPMAAQTGQYLYELPRFGTTIHVFKFDLDTQTRRRVFDLHWCGGRFVKA